MKDMKNMKGMHDGLADNGVAMDDVALCNAAAYAVDQAKPGSDVVGACLHANDRADSSASVASSMVSSPVYSKWVQTSSIFMVKIPETKDTSNDK